MNCESRRGEQANGCAAPRRNPGILIADDMAFILTLLKFELESRGFKVWVAMDGDDALDLYRKHREEIDVVLLDVLMPGLDGPHTLEALQGLNPDVVACFMTGNAGVYTEDELLDRGAAWIFSKPFRTAEVADLLQRAASVISQEGALDLRSTGASAGSTVSVSATYRPQEDIQACLAHARSRRRWSSVARCASAGDRRPLANWREASPRRVLPSSSARATRKHRKGAREL
jgi:CheY-like chemotaxis protein